MKDVEGKFINGDPSRLSWCYGDLGISIALLQAGNANQR